MVIGPMMLPEPIEVAPRREVPGRMVASGSIVTSASIQVAPGSSIVTPARMWARRIRRRASSATRARSARSLTPRFTAGIPDDVGDHLAPALADQRQDVGQVVLALGVVVGEPVEGLGERPGGEGVGAGVDLLDRELLGGGVAGLLRLDDPLDLAVRRTDDPAEGAGVLELGGHHRRGGAGLRVCREQALDDVGAEQGRVAGEDENRSGVADDSGGRAQGAAGSIGLGLDDRLRPLGQDGERSRSGETITQIRPAPASRAARMGQAIIGRPQTSCRTLGTAECMRVPSPAAMIRAVGAGGFTAES